MSDVSKIEWLNGGATWNVVRGCSRGGTSGPPCQADCYAERMAHRFSGPGKPYEGLTRLTADGPRWTGEVRCVPEMLDQPLHWLKPRLIFVNSMGDLFHEAVPVGFIVQVFAVMALAPWHLGYLLLTKRAGRMARILSDPVFREAVQMTAQRRGPPRKLTPASAWPLPFVWAGVSVEDQAAADARVPALLATPAAVRWLSCEPLLGGIDLRKIPDPKGGGYNLDALEGRRRTWDGRLPERLALRSPLERISWLVCGGETGPRSRPMHPEHARSLRNQCASSGTPYFFKSWGDWRPQPTPFAAVRRREDAGKVVRWGESRVEAVAVPTDAADDAGTCELLERVGKGAAGRELDGREWNGMPEVTP